MKWYCNDCNEVFEENEIVTETTWANSNYIGFGGDYPETTAYCPNCHSEDIRECEKCDACGEEVPETECFGRHTYLCDECRGKVEDKLIELRDYIQAEFDENDYKEAEEIIQDIADALFN